MSQKPVLRTPEICALAQAVFEHPWDSQEYEDAHNEFCEAARDAMSEDLAQSWDDFCFKATSREIVAHALNLLGIDCVLPTDTE